MKKAFTMLELIFVIIVIGILAAIISPQMKSNKTREAAIQIVSHIRYTQHLAMVDDKYDANDIDGAGDAQWFNRRWMIRFQQNLVYAAALPPVETHNNVWAYGISSDLPDFSGHHPDLNGMARNPLNTDQYLSGGYDNVLHVQDTKSMKNLRLGHEYGITNVVFGGGCRSTTLFIHFDHLRRPMNSFTTNSSGYQVSPSGYPRLIVDTCTITLSGPGGDTIIHIEPETGYAHIIDS